ncbi:hypothetical protein KWG72_22795 [Xanthomonas vasicola pv. vasculorum]|uniref:Uncharacterized protein n=3 Tax=Xanthomonas vasicola TaxID=56459 RepID=A0A837B587_XANVA|nr:hypothetical protein KWG_0113985 [Xanthomonas vasicola pv. vasculorum NCPPB 1381]MBV6894251.1 hypothetical protein [Xanthomonas vasicola pv. vasculorum]
MRRCKGGVRHLRIQKIMKQLHMDACMIRQVGDYILTAHATTAGAKFFPEILVSKSGGLTLRRHQVLGSGYDTYAQAVAYAESELGLYRVLSNGSLLLCHSGDAAAG